MNGIIVWLALIIPSILWGVFCAFFIKFKHSKVIAALIPWLVLLGTIFYTEYFTPYSGGGASMWPIAQLVGGTVAAVLGYHSHQFSQRYVKN